MKPSPPIRDPLPDAGFETVCARYAEDPQHYEGAASPPIYQTSTFIYPNYEAFSARRKTPGTPHYDYTRGGNPTTSILEAKLARLDGGAWAECFGSGMGAISAAINACVRGGDHVVAVSRCYGPTRWYLQHLERFGVQTTFVNSVDPADFAAALRPETKLLYLESPTSGRFDVLEIPPITTVARARGIRTIFDNSWASPYFQKPISLGCDMVVYSATKYLNGHSDIVAGALVGSDADLHRRVAREVELGGATLDPFAAWLMVRGLRTLALRMEYHQRSALAIAGWLETHPRVACVSHPGLATHPQHELARRQMRGYSSLFSFQLKEQSREATQRFLDSLKLFGQGVSWGGHESLSLGGTFFSDEPVPLWIIRLYAGLESTNDLMADLRQALDAG